jgi:hypothetical protein
MYKCNILAADSLPIRVKELEYVYDNLIHIVIEKASDAVGASL